MLSAALGAASLALCAAASDVRFDHQVRNDYFAGFGGDAAALERALAKTSAVLAAQPNHAEAMVWHGSGVFYQSSQYFRAGDQQKGIEAFSKGVAMMDKAVELAPNDIGVRIPRGAVLLQSSLYMPENVARPLIEKGLSDYARCYELQKSGLDTMGEHPKGELLFGIADAHRRLGNNAAAEEYFQLVVKTMPGTGYARRANVWLTTRTLTPAQVRCAGCHVDSQQVKR